jgi:tetratricopeptide (TPR) repeat protein
MKEKPLQIPHPSSERKVSPIIGRGAMVAGSTRKKRRSVEEDYDVPFNDDLEDHLEEDVLDEPRRKRIRTRKASSSRPSKTKKTAESENAGAVFQPAGSSRAEENTNHSGGGPRPANSSTPDPVQPPPKVSPSRKSRRRDTDSTIPSVLEESTSSPESAEELTEESPSFAPHIIALAQFQKILSKHPRMLAAAAIFTLLLTGFLFGRLQSGSSAEEEERALAKPSPQLVKELNEALALIESGQSSEALQTIQTLSAKHPDVSSLDYLAALAAMQAGDLKTAQEMASLSIAKNQKVSDSLVLLSMTESGAGSRGTTSLRDPKIVRESLLREAVESDVANPFPMIELASFLRSQKRDDEAIQLLKAANARLHPIDTHVVVQTSIQLMKLQQMPDEQLPAVANEGTISEIFASIYISLRKKDYNQAAIALEKGRHQAPPDLFAYLINDPVFKPFHAEPVMTRAL